MLTILSSKPSLTKLSSVLIRSQGLFLKTSSTFLHSSSRNLGLNEFFDDPENFGKNDITTGCAWTKDLLRRKSAVDLHKLWFVLLKERNMLITQEYYCMDHDEPIQGPDRLDKVAESMSNLRDVIDERQSAKNVLLYGRTDKEGGEYRKNVFGFVYYYKNKEHLMPKEMKNKQLGDSPAEIASFNSKIEEMHLRMYEKRQRNLKNFNHVINLAYKQVRRANPDLPRSPPQWWRKRFHCQWKYGMFPKTTVLFNRKDFDDRKQFYKRSKPEFDRV